MNNRIFQRNKQTKGGEGGKSGEWTGTPWAGGGKLQPASRGRKDGDGLKAGALLLPTEAKASPLATGTANGRISRGRPKVLLRPVLPSGLGFFPKTRTWGHVSPRPRCCPDQRVLSCPSGSQPRLTLRNSRQLQGHVYHRAAAHRDTGCANGYRRVPYGTVRKALPLPRNRSAFPTAPVPSPSRLWEQLSKACSSTITVKGPEPALRLGRFCNPLTLLSTSSFPSLFSLVMI